MPTIQPFMSGWGMPPLVAMLFWPGWMSNGPSSKCSVTAPSRVGSSATVVVVDRATVVCGTSVVVPPSVEAVDTVVALFAGAVLPSPLLHAATTMAPAARTAKNDGAVRMGALSAG